MLFRLPYSCGIPQVDADRCSNQLRPVCALLLCLAVNCLDGLLIHQKLFTPPPTDEQQEMQHRIMKFMMIFFAFMFFRVPAGLCLYFVTSSAWGLAERKLLPKSQKAGEGGDDKKQKKQPATVLSKLTKKKESDSNGASKIAERRKQRQKRR